MGGLLSNFGGHHQTNSRESTPPPGSCLNDPRSPSCEIQRTPIVVDKKSYLETDIDALTPAPLRVRVLKMNFDPRSPSVGVIRTPIVAVTTNEDNSNYFASPVSLYSNYQSEAGSCLPSPAEPSAYVSDFDTDLDSLVEKLNISESDVDSPVEKTNKLQLRTSPMDKLMTKKMCEDLIVEIIESFKECQANSMGPNLKSECSEKQFVPADPESVSLPGLKIKKSRKPLANITSSAGNTPTKLHFRKSDKFVPVERLGENSPLSHKLSIKTDRAPKKISLLCENSLLATPPAKRAQWDHDNTVII